MDNYLMGEPLEDFRRFCARVAVDESARSGASQGPFPQDAKARYALAIIRAVRAGAFGDDNQSTLTAISALWDRGCRCGFNTESFNRGFEEYFSCW